MENINENSVSIESLVKDMDDESFFFFSLISLFLLEPQIMKRAEEITQKNQIHPQ